MTIDYRPPLRMWLARLNRTFGIGGYVAAITVMATIPHAFPLFALVAVGFDGIWLSLLGVLGAIPAIDAAVALVNRGVTWGFGATLLPALELANGVPSHLRTLVAVPTLLTTAEAIEEQIEQLEIHHLASPDGDLHFALLSDWTDAMTERPRATRHSLRLPSRASAASIHAMAPHPAVRASCCSIVDGSGTKAKAAGSVGSESAASFTN